MLEIVSILKHRDQLQICIAGKQTDTGTNGIAGFPWFTRSALLRWDFVFYFITLSRYIYYIVLYIVLIHTVIYYASTYHNRLSHSYVTHSTDIYVTI